MVHERLKCSFCGYESTPDDFDLDEQGQGFWCCNCDGYTFFPEKEGNMHKFTLILENKAENGQAYPSPKFLKQRLSPLRYPGGKSKLIGFIYSKIRDKNTDTFVEPYCGGASIGLSLLEAGVINNLILNDLDYGVYSLFSIIISNPEELIKRITEISPTHSDYFTAREIIKNGYQGCSPIDAAWYLLINNRLAYSGIYKANPMGGRRGNQKTLLSRWNPDELCKRINTIYSHREHIKVYNMDAYELIEEMYWCPKTTIFVDPPYYNKGKDLYMCYYEDDDHEKLRFLLDTLYMGCPGADIIVTYDNVKYIEDLYFYPEIEKINRLYVI